MVKDKIFFHKISKCYNIIILLISLLISTFYEFNCQNIIISKDSLITLRVSKSGEQKIFNSGTFPNATFIDNNQQELIKNYYDLNYTNVVTLKWTNEIDSCCQMFQECDSIIEINFTNFNAKNCENFFGMFKDCHSLISLDFSGFITSNKLIYLSDMFKNCYSLISLNLSTFDTSHVTNFGNMFCNCKFLARIEISNFNTENVMYIDHMFYGCKNLVSLNLSHFNTSKVKKMDNIFNGCESLKIIDFSNLDICIDTSVNDMFKNCLNLEYINIKNMNTNINLEKTFFNGTPINLIVCIDDDKTESIKNIVDNNNCILISCKEYVSGYKYKLNTENGCFTENCFKTNYKYEFQGICFENCPTNISIQRENSEELKDFEIDNINYFCKPKCDEEYPYEIINSQKCVNNCDITGIINKSCIFNYQGKDNSKIFDDLLKNIEDLFTSNEYNISEIEDGKKEEFIYKNLKVTLTSTNNQKNEENKDNTTSINLGDCEGILKIKYNISDNDTLFMKIIDVKEDGMMIPKILFDVYYKLNGTNLIKLNLSYCSDSKIDIFVPVYINEKNIDIYNASSGYYNDICYTTSSESGTDIILKDRKTNFIDDNKTICQESCTLKEYNYSNHKAKCSCNIVESSSKYSNIKIDKTKLYENFIDIKNIANINLLVCYKVLFSKNGLINNYGCYSLIPILIMHFIIIVIFYSKNLYNQIQSIINKISLNIDNLQINKPDNNKEVIKTINPKIEKIKKKKKQKAKNIKKSKSSTKMESIYKSNPIIKMKRKKFKDRNKNKNIINHQIIETNKTSKFDNPELNSDSKKVNKRFNQKNKIMSYNGEELNDLDYELAIKYDKRKYCEYYLSLLKTKHIFIFTFFNNTDYNSKIIKIDLFFFNFTLFFFINAIFFNDDTMHKIYKEKGAFDILDQLPQIIYSNLLSILFGFFLEMLAITEGEILKLKKINSKKKFYEIIKGLGNKIKIKFVIYFIISTIFLLFFWYYLSMFCAIYVNTQIHLIKDTIFSFILSLIEPFGIYLIPGLFRIPALSQNHNRYALYKFSQILQMILII